MTPDRAEYLARLAESIVVDLRRSTGQPIGAAKLRFVRDTVRRATEYEWETQAVLSMVTVDIHGRGVVRLDKYMEEVLL